MFILKDEEDTQDFQDKDAINKHVRKFSRIKITT